MNKLYKILLVSLFMFHASVAISGDAKLIDRVVALVDTDVVLGSELVRRTNSIIEQIKQRNQTVPPIDKLRDQVLDRLIVESLQIQMAKRVGVRISDAELDTTIAQVSQQNNQSVEQFRKDAVKDGTPWQLFREDIRREIMISRVRGGAVSRRIKVSDKEIDNLLAQINQQGLSRAQYSLGHILLPLAEGSSPEDVNEIRNLAQKLVSELRAGANFEEYAITYSKGQNALSGGGLGFRSLSQLPSLFAGSVKNMKAGDITEPLRSGSGLHILKLKEVKGGFETHSVIQTHVRHILVSPDAITD
ncbi:MAG: peptidylprolyl isomerase [Kangiellaceae bacterium]|nr:peptidylprolyl isomerase [Kangiellaceae bacterium]